MTRSDLTRICAMFIVLYVFSPKAAPVMDLDKLTFDCGRFTEGKDDAATAIFNVHNSGDSLLKISGVRPGCGCVVAAYDTFIAPGKSGIIRLEAKLHGYNGELRKAATVTSNAKNQPTVRLTLTATIRPVIAVSKQHIALELSSNTKSDSLFLSSLKKDLMITGIVFKSYDQNNSLWHDQVSVPITFEWDKLDSISPDGFTVFKLSIKAPVIKEPLTGEFIISTNHPDKHQIKIGGKI